MYRGYVYTFFGDEISYYLGSRYYIPQLGRFLNADKHTDTDTGVIGTNMYAYCNNNPVMFVDPTGQIPRLIKLLKNIIKFITNAFSVVQYSSIFIVYENHNGENGFEEQANWMKSNHYSNKKTKTLYVTYINDFINTWNNLSGKIKDIHLFLHGGIGKLYFDNEDITAVDLERRLSKKNISGKIYLFSCNGGSSNSNDESIAGVFAKKCNGSIVRAVVNGSVYYRSGTQIFDRKPLTKEQNAYWADFSYSGNRLVHISIGKEWFI